MLVVFGDDATIQRDTPGTVCVWVHAGHCWETIFLLLRCILGSPKTQLNAEGQSCVLCVVPHHCTWFYLEKGQQGWQKPFFVI